MRELFVYWRLSRHDVGAAQAEMQRLQAALRSLHRATPREGSAGKPQPLKPAP